MKPSHDSSTTDSGESRTRLPVFHRSAVRALGFAAVWACLGLNALLHGANVELLSSSLVEENALTFATGAQTGFGTIINGRTHQQTPLTTFNGYQYTTYYDAERRVCVGRRALPDGPWEIIKFNDYTFPGNDTHDTTVIGISEGDGTIHLAFDHHVHDLNYRVSAIGAATHPGEVVWDASLFGPVTDELGANGRITQVTYPRFFRTPNGNLMLYYRNVTSADGHGMIQEYNATTHTWTTGLGKFIARDIGVYTEGGESSNRRCPYLNSIGYAGDRLHVSWIWRDKFTRTSAENNHDICYAYSDDDGRTWRNSAGDVIGVTGSSFINLDSPGLVVVPVNRGSGLDNQSTHYAYPDGRVHIVIRRNVSGTSSKQYHHDWRDTAGVWRSEVIPFNGSRPKLIGERDGSLILAYTNGGQFRLVKGLPNEDRTAWTWTSLFTRASPTDGGEGVIDLDRWESERILSVYGQEQPTTVLDYGDGTPIDGLPSPLRVYDYHVSPEAIRPEPNDGTEGVRIDALLSWLAGSGALAHRVYLGTDRASVEAATPDSPEYLGQRIATEFQPDATLANATTFYWRVDAVRFSTITPAPVWSFTTLGSSPTISPIEDQSYTQGEAALVVPFTVGDDLTSADDLELTWESTNATLLPPGNLIFGGSGAERTLTLTPAAATSGTATVTLTVDDGTETSTTVFELTIFLVVTQDEDLASWDVATAWNPDGVPTSSGIYKTDLQLQSPAGAATFPGGSLAVLKGGELQLRNAGETIVTVDDLILDGGAVVASGAENETSILEGAIEVVADSTLSGFSTPEGPRNLSVRALIEGAFTVTAEAAEDTSTHRVSIENPANTFAGTWMVENGSLAFGSAEAIGTASIMVGPFGRLIIAGDWNTLESEASLEIADTATASIDLDTHNWALKSLTIGEQLVDDGYYTVADLNALSDVLFDGSGSITVRSSGSLETQQVIAKGLWDDPTTWEPNGIPLPNFDYVTNTNLFSPTTTATFGGRILTVKSAGQLQVRTTGDDVVTVPALILDSGMIAAGTGSNVTNTLDGTILLSGTTRLKGYWNSSGPRNMRILSLISGSGDARSFASNELTTHTLFIDNPLNTFEGNWSVERGILEFAHPGAVGKASIVVDTHGKLVIHGDWNQAAMGATLTVSDSPTAAVDFGAHHWTVATFSYGTTGLAEGTYTAEQLNTLGATLFSGTGSITVGIPDTTPPDLEAVPRIGGIELQWTTEGHKLQWQKGDLDPDLWTDYPDGANSPIEHTLSEPTDSPEFFRLAEDAD